MKFKATRKEIEKNFTEIFLLDSFYGFLPGPFAYNYGIYGWNWDAYDLGDICVIVGDRNFPRCKRLPESAKQLIEEYGKEHLSERVKIDKKYLDIFITTLTVTESF